MDFTRSFTKVEELKASKLFNEKLKKDIQVGLPESEEPTEQELLLKQDDDSKKNNVAIAKKKNFIFPAVRNGRIDFYWRGGKLLSYDGDFTTHNKYASILVRVDGKTTNNQFSLKESSLAQCRLIKDFCEGYERLKENCKNYSGLEALGVASLYEKYSCVANTTSEFVVLDIEASFENISTPLEESQKRTQDRVDIVVLNRNSGELFFIEAKHVTNGELTTADNIDGLKQVKVISQIKRYRKQILQRNKEILSAYEKHVEIINTIFNVKLPTPEKIYSEPILFVFGFDADQKAVKVEKIKNILKEAKLQYYFKGDVTNTHLETLIKTALEKK